MLMVSVNTLRRQNYLSILDISNYLTAVLKLSAAASISEDNGILGVHTLVRKRMLRYHPGS